jgi:hypothetical protein
VLEKTNPLLTTLHAARAPANGGRGFCQTNPVPQFLAMTAARLSGDTGGIMAKA